MFANEGPFSPLLKKIHDWLASTCWSFSYASIIYQLDIRECWCSCVSWKSSTGLWQVDNNLMNNSKWHKQAKLVTRHEGNPEHMNKSSDHAEDKRKGILCFFSTLNSLILKTLKMYFSNQTFAIFGGGAIV